MLLYCDVGKSHAVLPRGGLQISRASREDAGTYMCVAQNPAGTALGKIKLNVQGTYLSNVSIAKMFIIMNTKIHIYLKQLCCRSSQLS